MLHGAKERKGSRHRWGEVGRIRGEAYGESAGACQSAKGEAVLATAGQAGLNPKGREIGAAIRTGGGGGQGGADGDSADTGGDLRGRLSRGILWFQAQSELS